MIDLSLTPPPELDYGIRVDKYHEIGEEYGRHCQELADLAPDGHVLDVGCGFAPLAAGLAGYLSPEGCYLGIDAVRTGVEWAARTITPRYPNFRFSWVDTYNQTYHRSGQLDPRSFRFPAPDHEFDLVYLLGVHAHAARGSGPLPLRGPSRDAAARAVPHQLLLVERRFGALDERGSDH